MRKNHSKIVCIKLVHLPYLYIWCTVTLISKTFYIFLLWRHKVNLSSILKLSFFRGGYQTSLHTCSICLPCGWKVFELLPAAIHNKPMSRMFPSLPFACYMFKFLSPSLLPLPPPLTSELIITSITMLYCTSLVKLSHVGDNVEISG